MRHYLTEFKPACIINVHRIEIQIDMYNLRRAGYYEKKVWYGSCFLRSIPMSLASFDLCGTPGVSGGITSLLAVR